MKFTLSWLKDHLDTEASVEEIAAKLNAIGLEVEGVEDPAARLTGFTVARVLTAERHPNADKLQVLQLRHAGTGEPATGVDLPRYRTPDGRWQLGGGDAATGVLRAEVAAQFGLRRIPVVAGAGDNAAGAIGMGIVQIGRAHV